MNRQAQTRAWDPAARLKRLRPLTWAQYRAECLHRNPAFRKEARKLGRQPKARLGGKPIVIVGEPSSPEAEAAFCERWGVRRAGSLSAPDLAPPILDDPAFAQARWETAIHTPSRMALWYDRKTRDRMSREAWGMPWKQASKLSFDQRVRLCYSRMSPKKKTALRQQGGPHVLQQTRLLLPIGPETKLEDIERLWPRVVKAQDEAYGAERPEKRQRKPRGLLELRLVVWDIMEADRTLKFREVARRLGCSVHRARRAWLAAARDINGAAPPPRSKGSHRPTPPPGFDPETHVQRCAQCRQAQTLDAMCNTARAYANQDYRAGDLPVRPVVLDEATAEAQEFRQRQRRPRIP